MRKVLNRFTVATCALGLVVFGLVIVGRARAASAAFSYDTKVTYTVANDTTTNVVESYTVTNNTERQYLTELKLTTPSDELANLKVNYADGTTIPTKQVPKAAGDASSIASQEITMQFPRVNAGSGQRWQFVVSYSTKGLIETKGSAHTVIVPALERSNQRSSYQATVDVPENFGTPHFADSQDKLVLKGDGRQVYSFDQKDLSDHSLSLVFGDSTIYNVTFHAPLHNTSPVPRTLSVTLPPDLSTQSSAIKNLNPAPKTTRLDADGNVLAEYTLAPYQKMIVQAKVDGQVRYRDYNLAASGTRKDLPPSLVAAYTKSSKYWPTGGAVATAARSVVEPEAKVADNVHAVYRYVIDKLTYNNDKIAFNVRQGAAKALANPQNAICLEYADLMIAMLRSQGIPARMVVGYAYAGSIKASPTVADSLHSWVEAYVPGIGWMSVDPTWGEKFDDFGRSDLDHYAFAIWGKNDSAPGAVMLGNTDTGYQYEKTDLRFSSTTSSIPSSGSLSVKRYVIAPFISLDRVQVTAQSQIVTTGNTLVMGTRTLDLGTLAPEQKVSFRTPFIGSDWNKTVAVQLQRHENGETIVVAKSTADVSYWPMLMIAGVLIALWVASMIRLRSKQRASNVKKIYTDNRRKRDVLDE